MLKNKFNISKVFSKKGGLIFLFQLSVFSNYAFDLSEDYYIIGKVIMLIFMIFATASFLKDGLKSAKALIAPLIFLLYITLGIIWATNKQAVGLGLVTQVQYFILLLSGFYVVQKYGCIKDYLIALYLSGFGLLAVAFIQYGGVQSFINMAIGGTRMGGEVGNENIFGMAFSLASIASFYFFAEKKGKLRFLHLVITIMFAFFSFTSQSKKAVIMILLGVFLLLLFRFGIKRLWKFILAIGIFSVLFIWFLRLEVFEPIYTRLEEFLSGQSSSDSLREDLIKKGIVLFFNRPLFGYGYDNYATVAHTPFYAHNNFVELLVDVGLIGFIIYYSMYVIPFINIFVRTKKNKHINQQQLHLLQIVLVLILIDVIIGYGAVQFVEKSTWISLSVYIGTSTYIKNANKSYYSVKNNMKEINYNGIVNSYSKV